jgi:cation channel sperm-associated protein subunit delta
MFHDSGRLEILTPVFDGSSLAFDFEKCSVNIQAVLMEPELQVPKCKVCDCDSPSSPNALLLHK